MVVSGTRAQGARARQVSKTTIHVITVESLSRSLRVMSGTRLKVREQDKSAKRPFTLSRSSLYPARYRSRFCIGLFHWQFFLSRFRLEGIALFLKLLKK
jgi:hypothetical protein